MRIQPDAWLADALGRPAFRVVDAGHELAPLMEHLGAWPRAFHYAKVDCARVDTVERLGKVGFFVADLNVTLEAPADARAPAGVQGGVVVAGADERDGGRADLSEVARSCFRFDRFHLDPHVAPEVADGLKVAWVESYLRGARGDRLFVAWVDERPVGFLAALVHDGSAVIDLMGVSVALQRRGVGLALVAAFFAHYRGRCARFRVGTQAANLPSLRFYARMGFSVVETQYVLHRHGADPGPSSAPCA